MVVQEKAYWTVFSPKLFELWVRLRYTCVNLAVGCRGFRCKCWHDHCIAGCYHVCRWLEKKGITHLFASPQFERCLGSACYLLPHHFHATYCHIISISAVEER